MKLTLKQVNLAMRVYSDIAILTLPAEIAFKIDDNYAALRNKNELFISKVLLIGNEFRGDENRIEHEIAKWSDHEVDIEISILGTYDSFKQAVVSCKENKIKPGIFNAIGFMFE